MEKTNEKKVFAQGICFSKLFWIFVLGCIVGTYYEQFLTLFMSGNWASRQGVIYGPFNPVYGFGMLIMVWALHNQKDWKRLMLYGAIAGGGLEYLLSFLQEFFIGSRSWDYTHHLLNINGRTTIPLLSARIRTLRRRSTGPLWRLTASAWYGGLPAAVPCITTWET